MGTLEINHVAVSNHIADGIFLPLTGQPRQCASVPKCIEGTGAFLLVIGRT